MCAITRKCDGIRGSVQGRGHALCTGSTPVTFSAYSPITFMNRNDFLKQADVDAFIDWLSNTLPTLRVALRVAESPYNPVRIDHAAVGAEDVLRHYCWKASWKDARSGETVRSSDWSSTRQSLARLSEWLRETVLSGDDEAACLAAKAVLIWGGVRGAIPFVDRLTRERRLCVYIRELAPLFALDGDQQVTALDATNVERFDAGLTKIHALFDTTGSPIYDSRVGAAFAMLYGLFRDRRGAPEDRASAPLRFPSGLARGAQIRNPGDLGMTRAPQFYTNRVSYEDWARWQLKTGWIIRAVLEKTTLFADEGAGLSDLAARAHAFEASMFMLGYDLRCLQDGLPETHRSAPLAEDEADEIETGQNRVPTNHPFATVIEVYARFREANPANHTEQAFHQWMQDNPEALKWPAFRNAFGNYIYPLRPREFDLFERAVEDVRCIAAGKETGLVLANNSPVYVQGDDRERVCIDCAGLTGLVYASGADPKGRAARLVRGEFAGTAGSASLLLTVGRAVGRHFGLLDAKCQPTEWFKRFFGNGLDDFKHRLGL
jgi:hypothetical protein